MSARGSALTFVSGWLGSWGLSKERLFAAYHQAWELLCRPADSLPLLLAPELP